MSCDFGGGDFGGGCDCGGGGDFGGGCDYGGGGDFGGGGDYGGGGDFGGGVYVGGWANRGWADRARGRNHRPVYVRVAKVVEDEHGGEEWVIVDNHRSIYKDIAQPDPNRQALSGKVPNSGELSIRYTYGDELPKKITQATVCAVICSILATPLVLICIIPMILKLKEVCLILE